MNYLSQIILHKQEAVRYRLRDSYAWHRVLWDTFPGRNGDSRQFLFRIDDHHPYFRVLLLSPYRPVIPGWGQWECRDVSATFLNHKKYRFQLKANPTMRRVSDRRRIGIYAEPRLRDWITRKANNHGFSIEPNTITLSTPIDEVFFRDGHRGKHVSVDFRGVLRVTAPDVFRLTFQKGIGAAKAFGFGLLMLDPLPT